MRAADSPGSVGPSRGEDGPRPVCLLAGEGRLCAGTWARMAVVGSCGDEGEQVWPSPCDWRDVMCSAPRGQFGVPV